MTFRLRGRLAATALALLGAASSAAAEQIPVLTIATQANPTGLDAQQVVSNVGSRLNFNIFDRLIYMDYGDGLALKPGLATSWTRIDDRTIEFKLRRDVRFHDGTAFTAEDVVFTFAPERILTDDWPTSMTPYFGGFARVEAVDDYTVRVKTKAPDPVLEFRLAHNTAAIISKDGFEAAADLVSWAQKPIGTGPYAVKAFEPDERIVMEANPDYFGAAPAANEVRWVVVPEVAARVSGLVGGDYDIVTDVPPDQIPTLEGFDGIDVRGGPIGNHLIYVVDTQNPVLADRRVRQALNTCFDRELIVETLWGGQTGVPKGHQFDSFGPLFDADRAPPAYDPKGARALLEKAGYDGAPIPLRIRNNYYTNEVATAQVVADMCNEVGLNVVIEMKETSGEMWGSVRAYSNSMHYPDPVGAVVRNWGPDTVLDRRGVMAGIETGEFFAAADVMKGTTDPTARRKAFKTVLDFWETEVPGIMLHQNALFYGVRTDINWRPVPFNAMDLRRPYLDD